MPEILKKNSGNTARVIFVTSKSLKWKHIDSRLDYSVCLTPFVSKNSCILLNFLACTFFANGHYKVIVKWGLKTNISFFRNIKILAKSLHIHSKSVIDFTKKKSVFDFFDSGFKKISYENSRFAKTVFT